MPMNELQPKTDSLANNWWHLIAEIDKVPASHTDWLCNRLATITRFSQTHASEFPIRERIMELVIEIHEAHKFNSWPNTES